MFHTVPKGQEVTRTFIGRLDTDEWNDPIVDGVPVDLTAFVGKRVEIVVRELPPDLESYENLAKAFDEHART